MKQAYTIVIEVPSYTRPYTIIATSEEQAEELAREIYEQGYDDLDLDPNTYTYHSIDVRPITDEDVENCDTLKEEA